jgi:hypothetical protein
MGSRNHGNVGARTESRKRRKRRNGDGDRMETKIETENMVHNNLVELLTPTVRIDVTLVVCFYWKVPRWIVHDS